MPPKEKYTDPELRDEIKEEIKAGDKGGKPGQWSARKAQFMAAEYKKRGGGYNEPKDASQKHLSEWTEEQWQTKEGSGNAMRKDGIEKRYLPKAAWDNMTEEEKEETERLKIEGGKEGKQFVGNTKKASAERAKASAHEEEGRRGKGKEMEDKEAKQQNEEDEEHDSKKSAMTKAKAKTSPKKDGNEAQAGQKRTLRSSTAKETPGEDNQSTKKQKTNNNNGSSSANDKPTSPSKAKSTAKSTTRTATDSHSQKKDDQHDKASHSPPASAGSSTRLPKQGQTVYWKSGSSYTEGEVVEIVRQEKEVEGVHVKGAEGDPRVVVRSRKSGKVAGHKVEACYFD